MCTPNPKPKCLPCTSNPDEYGVGINDATAPRRSIDDEAHLANEAWSQLLRSTPFQLSMHQPMHLAVTATADAMMASTHMAGLSGAERFSNVTSANFQFEISRVEAKWIWVLGWRRYAETRCSAETTGIVCSGIPHPHLSAPIAWRSFMPSRALITVQLMQHLPKDYQ